MNLFVTFWRVQFLSFLEKTVSEIQKLHVPSDFVYLCNPLILFVMKILLDVHTHTVASGHAFSTLQGDGSHGSR